VRGRRQKDYSTIRIAGKASEQLKALLAKVKGLELIRTYDFWFDINDPCRLSKKSCDVVLVLQKKA
jgi:NDP-sugar pyrophosphorylase family protein